MKIILLSYKQLYIYDNVKYIKTEKIEKQKWLFIQFKENTPEYKSFNNQGGNTYIGIDNKDKIIITE